MYRSVPNQRDNGSMLTPMLLLRNEHAAEIQKKTAELHHFGWDEFV